MLKQVILILTLSVLSIMFKAQLSHILDGVVAFHNYLASTLHIIFSDDEVGSLIQDMIAILVIPMLCGLIVTLVSWFVKRGAMPHTMGVIWMIWLVLIVTMIAQDGMVTNQMANQSKGTMHASVQRREAFPNGRDSAVDMAGAPGRGRVSQRIPALPQ